MPAKYRFGHDVVWPVGMAHRVLWLACMAMSLLALLCPAVPMGFLLLDARLKRELAAPATGQPAMASPK